MAIKSKKNIDRCRVIGFVVDTSLKPRRDVMLEWIRYACDCDGIEMRFFFANHATSAANLLEFADSGVNTLVLCGLQKETVLRLINAESLNIPVVVLCTYAEPKEIDLERFPKVGIVMLDNEAVGRHAAEVFLEHGLDAFGFLAMNLSQERISGQIRSKAFRDAVMAGESKTFSEKFFGVCRQNGDFWDEPLEELVSWVKTLSLPCGVFVNGDRSAVALIEACRYQGIDVPGQIEVLSVNNSQGLCEVMEPAISSIQPDFNECARQSIAMARDLANEVMLSAEDRVVKVDSHKLVERGSTLSGRSYGKVVTRAKEFIRKNACYGISVMDVAKHLGISRRTLEMRVKYATGSSVLGLIRDVRLENICRLLETTDFPISEVVTRSGYNLTGNVGVFFKKTYGLTMFQYRAAHRAK